MNLLERYRYPIIGGLVGLIIAICIFTIGFWKMILLFLLIGLGIFFGLYLQRTGIIEQLLKKTDIILPAKRHYFIESLYSHYSHTHYEEHLIITRNILEQTNPAYLEAYDRIMKKRSGHMFNMFIMSRKKCNEYCSWLFPILEELEKQVDFNQYDAFQRRMFGRVSELLLNVWIEQKQYNYQCVPVVNIEKSNLHKRIPAFLKAKFLNKKYSGSF